MRVLDLLPNVNHLGTAKVLGKYKHSFQGKNQQRRAIVPASADFCRYPFCFAYVL